MKITYILCLIAIVISFVSCQKKKTENEYSKITFNLPDLSGGQSSYSSHVLNQRSNVSDPTKINEVNCFALMVSGPDPFLNRTNCPVVDGEDNNLGNVTVGMIAGLFPRKSQATLFVPAGPKRKFFLVGVKADPITACVSFNDPSASADFTSSQILIGESAPVDLPPGAEVNVPIKIAASGTSITDGDRRLGTCVGPDSPSNKGKVFPTRIKITKNSFPYNVVTSINSNCNQLELNFVDDKGELGQNQANAATAQLKFLQIPTNASGTAEVFSDPNCSNSLNSTPPYTFTLPQFVRSFPIFTRIQTPGGYTGYKFGIQPISSPYPGTISEEFPATLANQNNASMEIIGPRRIISQMCYNFTSKFRTFDKIATAASAVTVGYTDVATAIMSSCNSGAITSGATHALAGEVEEFPFSAQFSHGGFANTFFTLTPNVTSATQNFPARYDIQVVGGSRNPSLLRPEVKRIPITNGCYGPFQIIVENERGGAIVSDGNIQATLPTAPANISLYTNSACTGTYQPQYVTDYRQLFWIKVSGTISAQNVPLSVHGEIEHPDHLDDPNGANFVASMTTVINVQFAN